GLAGLRRHARRLALAAGSESLLLLALFLPPTAPADGILDIVILAALLLPARRTAEARRPAVTPALEVAR
ncbi:MAG TPA: hypothetical protein VF771_15810, partial [Longimicrobiaceae bacterium]